MLTPLDNEVIFKKAFTDKTVFKTFVHDVVGIDIEVEKIETEKRFSPLIGNIDFAYDIFAESTDHRAIIELQRVEYDYHFDRFLHYHAMAIAELQRSASGYLIDKTVYTVVILTAPYTIVTKRGIPVQDEVLVSQVDPRTLDGQVREIYGHKLIFLNPHYQNNVIPDAIRDWLDLIAASIHKQDAKDLNLNNQGIRKVVEIIDFDKLNPVEIRIMKEAESKKQAMLILKNDLEHARKVAEEAVNQREEALKQKEEALKQTERVLENALKTLMETGLSEDEARKKLGIL